MTVTVIGGHGKMGQLFQAVLSRLSYSVNCLEKSDWDRATSLLRNAELALIAVPMQIMDDIIAKTASYLSSDTLLIDIASIKTSSLNTMLNCHQGPVLALHPMFAPNITFSPDGNINKQHQIVNCGGRIDAKANHLTQQLTTLGFNIVNLPAQDHDTLTAYIQGLHYFLVFAEAASAENKKIIALDDMARSTNSVIRDGYKELMIMLTDPDKYDLYEELMFACKERTLLYRQFFTTAKALITQDLESLKSQVMSKLNPLRSYFSNITNVNPTPYTDICSSAARMHYFFLFCEALILANNAVNNKQLYQISTTNYLTKINAIGNLLNITNQYQLVETLFTEKAVAEYHQALQTIEWIAIPSNLDTKAEFKKRYHQISNFIRDYQQKSIASSAIEHSISSSTFSTEQR